MSEDRSMTRPTGASIFSAADIKRRQPSARQQKLLKNCAMRRSRRKARGRDGGVSQTAGEDGRANDATSIKIPKYQYVALDFASWVRCGKRRVGDWIGGSSGSASPGDCAAG